VDWITRNVDSRFSDAKKKRAPKRPFHCPAERRESIV